MAERPVGGDADCAARVWYTGDRGYGEPEWSDPNDDGYGGSRRPLPKPRDGSFKELALEGELKRRDGQAWCGVVIINLASGDIVEWLRLEGEIVELFDVAALPGVRCPMSIGVGTAEIRNTVTFEANA